MAVETPPAPPQKDVRQIDTVTIRFTGDSGDGMQLTGDRFTSVSAQLGNDVATLPDFPAEIRAPAGSLPGVSGFQLHFADHDILTPGDAPDVLVAMNPAALKTNIDDLVSGGMVVVNSDAFNRAGLRKAGYDVDPLSDDTLQGYQVVQVPITSMTLGALEDHDLGSKDKQRAKNMFALGLMCWMYSRPTEPTIRWLRQKFRTRPEIAEANVRTLEAGFAFGETTELFAHAYEVRPAPLPPGRYRQMTGNLALAYGLIAAARRADLPLFLGGYPITPASDILHELSKHKNFGVRTFQAEDEIAGIGAALGAAFAGNLAATTTSGPGIALKGETIGLAVSVELPLLIINIQRGGPSTGLPTKTEQSDLLQAMFGRNGEAPVPVVAPSSAGDCFSAVIEAVRIALTYRTPVMLLSDGYLANGAEPWRLPNLDDLPDLSQVVRFASEPNHDGEFWPFLRDPETLARPWAIPGTAGLEHRIGGLEKADGTGAISYEPDNHHRMVKLRAAKVAGIADTIPSLQVDVGSDRSARPRLLVLGWGSTAGPIEAAVRKVRRRGLQVARAHLRHLNPFPSNTVDVLRSFDRVLVPEMNDGQLRMLLRAESLVDIRGYNRIAGLPFTSRELEQAIVEQLSELQEAA
ncbi:MAG: 2-oxoacid:acceptor oxidoreductase subunit alpha [Nitriliruptorales bacterium]|nr:2-oxoacid:acceptor oxidoreductase subunit alpha [Nitriliruptorales bacterium]